MKRCGEELKNIEKKKYILTKVINTEKMHIKKEIILGI